MYLTQKIFATGILVLPTVPQWALLKRPFFKKTCPPDSSHTKHVKKDAYNHKYLMPQLKQNRRCSRNLYTTKYQAGWVEEEFKLRGQRCDGTERNRKARRELGYNPHPLEEGLRETLEYEIKLLGMHCLPNKHIVGSMLAWTPRPEGRQPATGTSLRSKSMNHTRYMSIYCIYL
jgi:hypothetical protein